MKPWQFKVNDKYTKCISYIYIYIKCNFGESSFKKKPLIFKNQKTSVPT